MGKEGPFLITFKELTRYEPWTRSCKPFTVWVRPRGEIGVTRYLQGRLRHYFQVTVWSITWTLSVINVNEISLSKWQVEVLKKMEKLSIIKNFLLYLTWKSPVRQLTYGRRSIEPNSFPKNLLSSITNPINKIEDDTTLNFFLSDSLFK